MPDRREEENRSGASPEKQTVETQPGEPGRTPGTAEGDRETVEESLRNKEK